MKVYVASKFSRAQEVRAIEEALRYEGHEVTSSWVNDSAAGKHGREFYDYIAECAQRDYEDVTAADVLVFLHDPASRGGFAELGIALGAGRVVAVLGGRTASPHKAPIFYCLPKVRHFETTGGLVEWLNYLDDGLGETKAEELEKSR